MRKLIVFLTLLSAGSINFGQYIDGVNWADRTVSFTDKIQSWADGYCGGPGPSFMEPNTPSTTWWVLGPADADANGDMYAWDFTLGDRDFVAGWRTGSALHADQEIIVEFDAGIEDVPGNDLVIRMFCGPAAKASVWASTDGFTYTEIGTIEGDLNSVPGMGGFLYDAFFDLNGLFADDIHFVRVVREVTAAQSGMFFDSFSSAYIHTPSSPSEVSQYGWNLVGDIDASSYVNSLDFASLAGQWQVCNDPNDPELDSSLFPDPNSIPSSCHGIFQAGLGLEADINQDCVVNMNDLYLLLRQYLECNNPEDESCVKNW